jgi:ABC-type nitrate/sulfonate/bicarbonate transport system permease component
MQPATTHHPSTPQKYFPTLIKWGLRIASVTLFAVSWELFAQNFHSLLMPTFSETVVAFWEMLGTAELWDALFVSNQAMVLGFTSAVAIGVPFGLVMGRWRWADSVLDPYLGILLVVPMSALIPVIIMAAGLGLFSRVLVVFLFSVAMVVASTRGGLRLLEPSWMEMARAFGANEWQLWTKIIFRGALPGIFTGMRLGLTHSITGMVTVELLLLALGIGRLLLDYQGTFEAGRLYATISFIIIEAVLLLRLFKALERRALVWAGQAVS